MRLDQEELATLAFFSFLLRVKICERDERTTTASQRLAIGRVFVFDSL